MQGLTDRLGRWLMFRFDPETAHALAVRGLRTGKLPRHRADVDPRLAVDLAGLHFPNPVGVAAGFDKNAEVPDALLGLGFGFTEVGTVTPRPQPGNPKPRVFRLPADAAVINRLGFNNQGHEAAWFRLEARNGTGIVGVNIGANKDTNDKPADYVAGLERFYALASYFTVNISSPNTPGLRDLQARDALGDLLARVGEARIRKIEETGRRVPVFLKIAPDVTETGLDDIVAEVVDKAIDGIVVSNTTLSRAGLTADPGEAGGLSGRPLFDRATIMLAKTRQRVGPDMALIGVGGVDGPETALGKIEAGADLVQLYTGMIYRGPTIARRICEGLSAALDEAGAASISDLRDRTTAQWATKDLPAE
ncbi:quinone-dependent dihydroorotate dehydrogenase [Roseitalea porphyridii]|uniref:Dihydroorotate dehydrogenase (quinone) n=1 Tax=Roseitalea porphyridii TaxID=1852022 RepID=A0A4P6V6X3_9HYPH|nr:quinone-dependent dihydroorotate dehydrogenase [Roseitalea porphyridii]QBK32210.1 quinone-dependent dihydroorotate dehydrogenase [Roseitalea porphyridii]